MRADRGWLVMVSGSVVMALVVSGCGGNTPAAEPASQPPVSTATPATPEAANYQMALKEFEEKVVPAARKEGELNWYTSLRTDEAEAMIQAFNKKYPDIQVNFVYGRGSQSIEKIAAETAAKRVVADAFWSGGNSSRVMGERGFAGEYIPPSVQDPAVKFNWKVAEGNGKYPIPFVRLIGVQINTKFVPKDKFPKTWWDLARDPFWVDLHKRGLVGTDDPRRVSYAPYVVYGLKDLNKEKYGEAWVKEWAALKPKRLAADAGEIVRGEIYAFVAMGLSASLLQEQAPVEVWCPDPGCVTTQYLALLVKGGPHPNAAKVWSHFWFTSEGQQVLSDIGFTPARADTPVHPQMDWKTHPQMFWPDNDAEKLVGEAVKWTVASKLFDY